MNKIALLTFTTLLLSSTASCATQSIEQSTLKKGLLGNWNCSLNIEENGLMMSMKVEDSYIRNGRSNSFGDLEVQFSPEHPVISYSIAGTSTWDLIDGFLVSTSTDIKIVNLTHPEFDEVFNLQEMFPTNVSDSSEIIHLSKNKLTLKSEGDNIIYQCQRKA